MKKRVYIETTIPSFYFEIRQEPEMGAIRNWTVDWWDNHSHQYELVTSISVIEELERGNHPKKNETLGLILALPILPIEDEINNHAYKTWFEFDL